MPTFAYIRNDSSWEQEVWFSFSDLIASRQAEFVALREGDLVLSLEPGRASPWGTREWILHRVLRVSKFEETGDAFNYWLKVVANLSSPVSSTRHSVTRDDLLGAHSWFPAPGEFFKPLPQTVWTWLRDARGVPLPDC